MSLRIDQIAATRVLPKATDYAEVGNATPESAKMLFSCMPQRVQTFAELKALVIAAAVDGFGVLAQGGAALGDGLGGLFRYSAASDVADDGANYLAPDVGAGRWIRHTDKTLPTTFATIAALKAFPVALVPNGSSIVLTGYAAAGDGGGGLFRYDGTSAAADNGGTIIAPTAGAGRWLRIFSGAVNVRWFGAVNGSGADNSAAFQAAIDTAAAGDLLNSRRGAGVFVPGGDYRISAKVTLKTGVRLSGESRESVRIISHVANDNLFFYDADATAANVAKTITLENFSIIGAVASNAAYIRITGAADLSFPSLFNLYIYGADLGNYGLRLNNTINAILRAITVQSCASHGFYFQASNNAAVIDACYATGNGGDGWNITGTQITLNGCASDSNDGNGYWLAGTGYVLNAPEAEDNGGDIIYLSATYNVTITSGVLYGSALSDNGVTLDAAVSVSIINTQIATQGGAPAGYTIRFINAPAVITLWQLITAAFGSGTIDNAGGVEYVSVETSANLRVRGLNVDTKSFLNNVQVLGLLEFADNAAALGAGLVAGDFYRTADVLKVVH